MISTVLILSWLFGQDPLFHLFAGSLILGAFYMATDMVTSPITKIGRWIFGIGGRGVGGACIVSRGFALASPPD